MLGRGVVIVGKDGYLQLCEVALLAQLHQPHLPKGERCYCPVCQADRDRRPQRAAPASDQPWEPKAPRRLAVDQRASDSEVPL
jgi:hypothetical protein